MYKKITFLLVLSLLFFSVRAQDAKKPTYVGKVDGMVHVSSIASKSNLLPAITKKQEMQDGRASRNIVVPGKDPQTKDDYFVRNRHEMFQKLASKTPSLVFDAYTSSSQPTDPSLAVGPNHVFVVFNTGFIIYDKNGNALTEQTAPNPAIFPSSGCCDLTASYDNAADRWVVSFLNGGGAGAQVAVSDGPDPVNDGWYVYNVTAINDYQKLSVWSDGYYMTDNTNATNKVWALEREKMLAGDSNAQILGFDLPGIVRNGFYSPQAFNVTNDNLPAPGNAPIVYMQDDAWSGVSTDHIKLWLCNVDWATPGNSTMSDPMEIELTPFISVFDDASFVNLTQPNGGSDIDALQATIMNQAQFRKFGSHNSAVFNFVVDTDASAGELAGVRWMELRQNGDGQPWSLYQEGTYTAPDNRHAWHASLAMDASGNIGMGYTSMSGPETEETVMVSSYYTGRYAADPLGTMTIEEQVIANGTGNIPGTRYGDYSKIDVDPSDDKTFFFINEYFNSQRKGVVGVFKIAPNFNKDVGVSNISAPQNGALTNAENVTVTIFNYGLDAASNFNVSYQVDGGTTVTEAFTGTIASSESAEFTFSTTADLGVEGQTYEITATTSMSGDEDTNNDSFTKQVTHLNANDIGAVSVIAPVSGTALGAGESIVVQLQNFGSQDQTGFDVKYNFNGTEVTETVSAVLAAQSTMEYTFNQTVDIIDLGDYDLTVSTMLNDDADSSNDSVSVVVTKVNCQPISSCTWGDGFRLFELADLSNSSECSENGYNDFTDMVAHVAEGTTYDLTITTGYGDQFVRVWVDFNDDFLFSADELIIDNIEIADGQTSGTHTETVDFVVPANANQGEHLMRAKSAWNDPVPDDACEESNYGETEDYKLAVSTSSVEDVIYQGAVMLVKDFDNNQFELELSNLDYNGLVTVTVHDMMGRRIVYYNLNKKDNKYTYPLDMSYMSPGVYLVRMGNKDFGKVQKIIVK
ncbi:MAG: hypothetical protein CR968_05360 [Flavobacteriia bacterium]|nr:MAG: hypothetical protein CR968_05360 [Flavobacteriia bacterium]